MAVIGGYGRAMGYQDLKLLVEQYSGLEKDALHIHVALLLYLIAMFAFRQTRRSRFPWLFVLLVELANEAVDILSNNAEAWVIEGSAKDLWNTMLWPTVLLFVGRYTDIFQHRDRTPPPAEAAVREP